MFTHPIIGGWCPIIQRSASVGGVSTPPETPALLRALIDDAGLFPPARLPMSEAVTAHLETRSGPYAPLVGRFLLPASRLDEFDEALPITFTGGPVRVGLIADLGVDALRAALDWASEPSFDVVLFEIPAPSSDPKDVDRIIDQLAGLGDAFVELPRSKGWADYLTRNLAALRRAGFGAKLRTGGLAAEAFPTEGEVAGFIAAAVRAEVPFKLTAGLHNALRHTDLTTRFEHHGFLNVALAVAYPADAETWLAERDGQKVADEIRIVDAPLVRSRWQAFGSCSIDEPVDDLVALGLLERR